MRGRLTSRCGRVDNPLGSGFPSNREIAVTELEFESLLALGHESNGVEFKGPGKRSDKAFLALVIRAILGMANRRDGGLVILGVESKSLEPVGLSDDDAALWLKYDELSEKVNVHASPNAQFELEDLSFRGRRLVIVRVREFSDVPILCAKDHGEKKGSPVLRRGACYVRARHKPETSEIPSEEERRELLELAIDKGVRKFVDRARMVGLLPSVQEFSRFTDESLFKEQLKDLE